MKFMSQRIKKCIQDRYNMRMSRDSSKTLLVKPTPWIWDMTCTSRNRRHSENESNDFFIDLIATCILSITWNAYQCTVFLVPRTLARTTLPKLPSPTSLITSNLFSNGCATPSINPKEEGRGVIVSDDEKWSKVDFDGVTKLASADGGAKKTKLCEIAVYQYAHCRKKKSYK